MDFKRIDILNSSSILIFKVSLETLIEHVLVGGLLRLKPNFAHLREEELQWQHFDPSP